MSEHDSIINWKYRKGHVLRGSHVYAHSDEYGYVNDTSICNRCVWSHQWDDCKCSYCRSLYFFCEDCSNYWTMLELAE